MLMVISPAKTLDFDTVPGTRKFSQPDYLADSKKLIKELKELSPESISELMHVSPKIGELNFVRYLNWQTPFTPDNAKQAAYAFRGDVYLGLEFEQFSGAEITFAQKHLRILSGLYGLLRPLDLIQPYRLEMGTSLANAKGDNLYQFWDNRITKGLNEAIAEDKSGKKILLNLASNEYFKAIKKEQLEAELITPVFKDYKNGKYKIISFFAKKARGMMAAYVIKNRIKTIAGLQQFDMAGYKFNADLSKNNELLFTRKQ